MPQNSLLLRTDVTAVKFYRHFILAGIGSSVNVFSKVSSELLQRILCLCGQKIYGFVPSKCGHKVLVYGGKQLTVLRSLMPSGETVFERMFDPVVCDDWLHSAVWVDDKHVGLLTAHNVVQIWNTATLELIMKHHSKDNSILYSGLLLTIQDRLLVMAGTVFSEVIIHSSGDDEPLHRLKGHKGVIFSITCQAEKGIIATTSDDRSIRIWGPDNYQTTSPSSIDFWKDIDIVCKHELYGHTARVMRSCITSDYIVSVGEDSIICFWNYNGRLARKIPSHQNGCVWSVDADENQLVTGGGDCAVIIHPLTLVSSYIDLNTIDIDIGSPKKVMFTARRNLVVLNENDDLILYNVEDQKKRVYKLNHESTYKVLSISSCKQMIAVADMNGKLDVFVENCKGTAALLNIIDTKLNISRVLSLHWAGNRHLVMCTDNGIIRVLASKGSSVEELALFELPPCKERWLTAAAVHNIKNIFILGDRSGNIHVYLKGQSKPVQSFTKVHGRYGPTSISIRNNEIIVTTGRDRTAKYFTIRDDHMKLMSSKNFDFQWVEKFLDNDGNLICGFQERVFVVCNIKTNTKLLEVPCGGGHRSWDSVRYFDKIDYDYEELIKFVYLKNSDINTATFQMSKIVSRNVINGSHSKEINCLKSYQMDSKLSFYITGGEDTTMRISVSYESQFEDQIIFKHLSSIRALKICPVGVNSLLVISAGGRAQICIKKIKFNESNDEKTVFAQELIDHMIKGTDKERKGNKNWRNCEIDFDPETRIMDVDYVKSNEEIIIFAGCSDANLRMFSFKYPNNFTMIKEFKYHKTCILKTNCIKLFDRNIVVTCTTRSEIAFWDVVDIREEIPKPFFVITTNKSGINSFVSHIITDARLLIATAGDDNAMHLVLLEATDCNLSSIKVLHSLIFDKNHSSQITGLCIVDKYILSTGIDQRITLFDWKVEGDTIVCGYKMQTYSDVADIQGMDLICYNSTTITACVFGKGMEVVELPLTDSV